eukprot:TRINITY_DN19149_c0_g1_i1.p1 TRINITY_DN19149_c0_g1~~TRINITY_DN19149_c0_g1_i1.p1  ORF type:complete len:150 (-),score=40.84 TRINITY_DN19149_c0_g1_i1:27-452(-)
MDRQKEERERGVTIACTTKEFYTEKWQREEEMMRECTFTPRLVSAPGLRKQQPRLAWQEQLIGSCGLRPSSPAPPWRSQRPVHDHVLEADERELAPAAELDQPPTEETGGGRQEACEKDVMSTPPPAVLLLPPPVLALSGG